MAADGAAVAVSPAPSPKSPPKYPDLCGRRRLQLEVQILNREIGFLEVIYRSIFHLFFLCLFLVGMILSDGCFLLIFEQIWWWFGVFVWIGCVVLDDVKMMGGFGLVFESEFFWVIS